MMGMCGVGRTVGSIALVVGALTGPFDAFSYGSATTHLEVTEAILGGYGGDDFREFFDVTSGAIDSMADDFETHFPEMRKKFNPWTHRLMGHSWSLDEDAPEWVLNRLEKEYGVSRPKVIHYCREYQEMTQFVKWKVYRGGRRVADGSSFAVYRTGGSGRSPGGWKSDGCRGMAGFPAVAFLVRGRRRRPRRGGAKRRAASAPSRE